MTERDHLLDSAALHARDYLAGANDRPVAATMTSERLRAELASPPTDDGEDPSGVLAALAGAGRGGTVATQGPRFFGFVTGSSLPVATAADWLVSSWDQNAAGYVMSPLVAVVEEAAGEWTREIGGLPGAWSTGFTTGDTMANFTALAAARHHLLRAEGWDVEADGLFGAPPVEVLVSAESHYSITTSLRMLGLGGNRVQRIAADGQGRMRADALADALDRTTGPCLVCAQAGNVNTGSFDPLEAIAEAAVERGAWLHVDAAFGYWVAAVPDMKHLLAGIGRADSVATDAHKWLNVPYDCGVVLCAHRESHRRAMTLGASYMLESPTERDCREYVPEESRRARSVPVYAVLRSLGRRGLAELVQRCCRHARRFAQGLREAGYEILNDIDLNVVMVSFGEPDKTRRVIQRIQEDGTCWCGGTEWQGRTAMRICVSSWATTDEDVEHSLEAMIRIAAETT